MANGETPSPGGFFTAWRRAFVTADAVLKTGFRLAILGRPSTIPIGLSAGTFWIVALLGVLISGALGYYGVEPPRQVNLFGVQSEGFYTLVLLLACFLITRSFNRDKLLWPLATLIASSAILAGSVTTLVEDHLLEILVERNRRWYWLVALGSIAWWIAIWRGTLAALGLGSAARQWGAAMVIVFFLSALSSILAPSPLWITDYEAQYQLEHATDEPSLIAEEVFSAQPELLDRALNALAPGTPGQPDLYFVAFAPYGAQDVFLKESLYSTRLFETRFGARGRTLTLVNNRQKVEELPLATVTNLDHSLRWIGANMDPAEDILFLFLTSHGSEGAELSVELDDLSFLPLSASALASALQASGIRWKVLVISGCYSGSFIDSVKDDYALVISAARADRKSFGCSDGAEFTYFGRAYFEQALNQTDSFVEAFAIASRLVGEWETREQETRSEPQIATGRLIEAKLQEWRAMLPPRDAR